MTEALLKEIAEKAKEIPSAPGTKAWYIDMISLIPGCRLQHAVQGDDPGVGILFILVSGETTLTEAEEAVNIIHYNLGPVSTRVDAYYKKVAGTWDVEKEVPAPEDVPDNYSHTKHNNRCLIKSQDDEPVFVLCARDPLAADTIDVWTNAAYNRKAHDSDKIDDALGVIKAIKKWRLENNLTND